MKKHLGERSTATLFQHLGGLGRHLLTPDADLSPNCIVPGEKSNKQLGIARKSLCNRSSSPENRPMPFLLMQKDHFLTSKYAPAIGRQSNSFRPDVPQHFANIWRPLQQQHNPRAYASFISFKKRATAGGLHTCSLQLHSKAQSRHAPGGRCRPITRSPPFLRSRVEVSKPVCGILTRVTRLWLASQAQGAACHIVLICQHALAIHDYSLQAGMKHPTPRACVPSPSPHRDADGVS